MMCSLLLAGAAQAQDHIPTAEQCNDSRLFSLEKKVFLGDGTMREGAGGTGRNGIQVNRAARCGSIDRNLLNETPFCMNVWDTTPCENTACQHIGAKIVGGVEMATASTHFVFATVAAGSAFQGYLVAATNSNAVRDNPANRLIITLADNPSQNAVFEIRDDD